MCFKKVRILLYFAAFFLILCDNANAYGMLLRPPMIFAKFQQKDKRTTSKETNPYLWLLRKQGARGNVTIDDHTIVISFGGGDTNGINTFIARVAQIAHSRGDRVVVVLHGIKGLLDKDHKDNLFEITPELAEKLLGLPSVASGSSRTKLDLKEEKDVEKIDRVVNIIKPAKKVIFIGGNDHLQLAKIIADKIKQLNFEGHDIKTIIMGASKSVDNDFKDKMWGFWTAFMAGRKIVKRASVPDNGDKTMVFEPFGRGSGALTLEIAKACPYSKAVLLPEYVVSIQEIIDAYNHGVRNFFTAEGFSLSEKDPLLDELLSKNGELRMMYNRAQMGDQRDAWGHPKLTGASLYVEGILKYFCKAKVGRTDLTYQLRGAFSEKDSYGRDFEEFLAEGKADIAMQVDQSGLAIVYDGDYGEYDPLKFGTRPVEEVYETIDLKNVMTETELAKHGVLGTKGVIFKADPVGVPEEDITLETAMRKAFYAVDVSTAAHTSASVTEFKEDSKDIVRGCGRLKPSEIAKLPYDLGAVVEGTQDSVLILIPERQASFYKIAKSIKKIIGKVGYVNIAISNRFALDPDDPLLERVLKHNLLLNRIFTEAQKKAQSKNEHLVTFDSGISQFILELFKYLKNYASYEALEELKIKFDSARITNMGYAFEGLSNKDKGLKSKYLSNVKFLKARGVIIDGSNSIINDRRGLDTGL